MQCLLIYCRYGIPDEYSSVFRSALTKLIPRYCKNKTIWLPSDTAMVPPPMLVKHGVSLCHTVQEPGQFILVFPRAFTSSICTGYLVSESVYFAQPSWLNTAEQVFRVSTLLEQIVLCSLYFIRAETVILQFVLSNFQDVTGQVTHTHTHMYSKTPILCFWGDHLKMA